MARALELLIIIPREEEDSAQFESEWEGVGLRRWTNGSSAPHMNILKIEKHGTAVAEHLRVAAS